MSGAIVANRLAELGLTSVVHLRGEGAVEATLREQPDVILLDIRLGQRDPQQAVAMAENLTGPLQRQVHSALLGGWVQSDPEAVDQWIRSRPEGGDKQDLIKYALNFTEALTPERAAALADTLRQIGRAHV